MAVTIALRTCEEGESFEANGACTQCAAPNYYSLSTMITTGNCKDCMKDRMYCKGGADIGPKPNYWRSSTSTDNFILCLYPPACLGYEAPDYNNLGQCLTGYQGILCADWTVGYGRGDLYKCSKCPNPIWNIIRLVLVFIAIIIGITITIRTTLSAALQKKNIQSVYIKLMMNHLQLIMLTASFEFDWPNQVEDIFNTTKPVAQVSSHILSFDCFLDQRNNSGDSNIIRLYYQKMIMYAVLPFILAIGCVTFWSVYFCKKTVRTEGKKAGRIMSTLIILFFLVHPSIVEYMFSNFK
jgi:hypothetical protein